MLKCRKTVLVWLTLLIAALLPLLNVVANQEHPDTFIPMMKRGPWELLFMMNMDNAVRGVLPVYCLLLFAGMAAIETRNNTWKQVYSLPRSYADIYFSRFLVSQCYVVLYIIFFGAFTIVEGLLLHALNHDFPLYLSAVPWKWGLIRCGRLYAGVLALSALQYCLSMCIRNFMVPVLIGVVVLAAGPVVHLLGWVWYDPYLYPRILFSIGLKHNQYAWPAVTAFTVAIGGFLLLLPGGFMVYRFRRGRTTS